MPVSVVVGGQFGSEGKGKVALFLAQSSKAAAVVRVGGPNSGHSAVDQSGHLRVFRQLPASALAPDTLIVLPAGSLIDPEILEREILSVNLEPHRLIIDANASVVTAAHREEERCGRLIEQIGSTGSGTGACLRERLSRKPGHILAHAHPFLSRFTRSSANETLRSLLDEGRRVVIEGTQGFGLSLWHGEHFPFATSRDTTAAGFVSETGLAPHDVDDVVLVIRSFPIRVGGNSGPMTNEINWHDLALEAELPSDFVERTSATNRVRRIGRFDAHTVRKAIVANSPHRIAINHLDYIDPTTRTTPNITPKVKAFIREIEGRIGRRISLAGFSAESLIVL